MRPCAGARPGAPGDAAPPAGAAAVPARRHPADRDRLDLRAAALPGAGRARPRGVRAVDRRARRAAGAAGRPSASTEQLDGAAAANSDQTAAIRATKPTWSSDAYERWRRHEAALPASARSDGGGPNFASSNPPLYYVWSVLPYWLASGGDLFARVSAMRIGSVVFLLVTVAATWLLTGTVLGPRRDLQLAAAAVPALLPMVDFISASVSPDSLLYALWTVGLWLGARVLRGRGGPVDLVALIAVAGMAIATKATSYAFAVPVAFVLGVELWRLRHRRRLALAVTAGAAAAVVLTAGAWFAVAGSSDRPAARSSRTRSTFRQEEACPGSPATPGSSTCRGCPSSRPSAATNGRRPCGTYGSRTAGGRSAGSRSSGPSPSTGCSRCSRPGWRLRPCEC